MGPWTLPAIIIALCVIGPIVCLVLGLALRVWARVRAESRSSDLGALAVALEDPEDYVREAAARALGASGNAEAVPCPIDALGRPRWDVRDTTADALARLGPVAVDPLLAALADGTPTVRAGAVRALGLIGDARALEPTARALEDDDWLVRRRALESLRHFGRLSLHLLLRALEQGSPSARKGAAELLGQIGDTEALAPLLAALSDPERWVRGAAASALGELGDARAVGPLISALEDGEPSVRGAAADALGDLGGAAGGALAALRPHLRPEGLPNVAGAIRRIEMALRAGPRELVAGAEPAGTGTELEAAAPPAGRGTEPVASEPATKDDTLRGAMADADHPPPAG